ncbi:unnamed protein product [Discula destructiva]
MSLLQGLRQGPCRLTARPVASIHPVAKRGIVTDADVAKARKYCVDQLRHGDYDAYLVRQFVPPSAQDAYDALRTLNLELARLPETVSNPTIGQLRLQFWRDTVNKTFAGSPPREPISILLHRAITALAEKTGSTSSASSIKFWLLRFINTREKHMENRPFTSLAALEDYAEHTYATMMYTTLASMPMRSVHMDHLASHIGKACGIVAVLRGVAVLAAPPRPVKTPSGLQAGHKQSQALLLPLDVMAEVGLREEDVFRHGPNAPGLQDAVFKVATRANDHLITAREMLKNMKLGQDPGHAYEHQEESDHSYEVDVEEDGTQTDVKRGFGVLLDGIAASDYLDRIEKTNFDPFQVRNSWKLPWRIWRAIRTNQI